MKQVFDKSGNSFDNTIYPTYFVLGELQLAKYYGDPKKLVSRISDFKIAGNSVIGQ